MTAKDPLPAHEEADLLLPWLATGRLGERDTARLARAVADDPERARHYDLVREELDETIRLNESLGAPSGRAAAQLFARIDAEDSVQRPLRSRAAGFMGWLRGSQARLGSGPRAWIAAAAAVVIVAQAGFLATLVLRDGARSGLYQTASGPHAGLGPGSFAVVSFAPGATAAQISGLLASNKATIADGPRGGLFTIRLSDRALPPEEIERSLTKLRQNTAVVLFAAPAQP